MGIISVNFNNLFQQQHVGNSNSAKQIVRGLVSQADKIANESQINAVSVEKRNETLVKKDPNVFDRVATKSLTQDKAINVLTAQCPSRDIVTAQTYPALTGVNTATSSFYNDPDYKELNASALFTSNVIVDGREGNTTNVFMQNGVHSGMAEQDICNGVIAGSATKRIGGTHGTQDNTVLENGSISTPVKLTDFGTEDIAHLVGFNGANLKVVDAQTQDQTFGMEHHIMADNAHIATLYVSGFTPEMGKHVVNADSTIQATANPTTSLTTGALRTDSPTTSPTTGAVHTDSPTTSPTTGALRTDSPTTSPTTGALRTDSPTTSPTTGAVHTDSPTTSPTTGSLRTANPTTSPTTGALRTANPTHSPITTLSPSPSSSTGSDEAFRTLPENCDGVQTVKPQSFDNDKTFETDKSYFYQLKSEKEVFAQNYIVDTKNSDTKKVILEDKYKEPQCNGVIVSANVENVVCSPSTQDNIMIEAGKTADNLVINNFGINDMIHAKGFEPDTKFSLKFNDNTQFFDFKANGKRIAKLEAPANSDLTLETNFRNENDMATQKPVSEDINTQAITSNSQKNNINTLLTAVSLGMIGMIAANR